jgi:hypothetical protein
VADPKSTIYIDIDDEITGIIDKMRASEGKIVALVLPKRATVFQSIVNMKLLKRAADENKKNVVLITGEAGLMPLAGAAGVPVAKTLNSKPEIPVGPEDIGDEEETIDEAGEIPEDNQAEAAGAAAAGALAGAAAVKSADGVETVELDDDVSPDDLAGASTATKSKSFAPPVKGGKKPKKDSKLKVPDFNRFRALLIAGGIALLALIIFIPIAIFVLPKATINIKTDATLIDTDLSLNLSTTATELNEEDGTLPAKLVQQQKTYTQQVATTGQKNNGNKASGSVTITNCARVDGPITLAAGTGFSSNGNTYISQSSVTVPESKFSGGGKCTNDTGKANVNVIAQSAGTSSNLPGNSSFAISSAPSGFSGTGNGMSGGTDNIVHVVNQNDINNAKEKINLNDDNIKTDLSDQLKKADYYALTSTYSSGTPAVSSSNAVGQIAENVTVTETVTYTMFGVKEDDLNTLVDNEIKGEIDTNKQSILDNGVKTATYTVNSQTATGAQIAMTGKASVGPDLDTDAIKQRALGKKPAAIRASFNNNPDVKDVDVKLSPFWVSSVPKKESKVTVKIAKPSTSNSSAAHGDNP